MLLPVPWQDTVIFRVVRCPTTRTATAKERHLIKKTEKYSCRQQCNIVYYYPPTTLCPRNLESRCGRFCRVHCYEKVQEAKVLWPGDIFIPDYG
ncbi:hypothetical protein BJV82DRAFT_632376 [Fennellomyces sp. T-0311]|nr:hypothetical protein BJV82DRAFT_632376 [Fennellomyces sp. T-0311]